MSDKPDAGYFVQLQRIVEGRKGASTEVSYIAKLFAKGRGKMAQKMGEEAVETAIAAVSGTRQDTIEESADLLFHLLVLLTDCGIRMEDVLAELKRREGISGLDEKKSRMRKEAKP